VHDWVRGNSSFVGAITDSLAGHTVKPGAADGFQTQDRSIPTLSSKAWRPSWKRCPYRSNDQAIVDVVAYIMTMAKGPFN
jgi:hypothetical protein